MTKIARQADEPDRVEKVSLMQIGKKLMLAERLYGWTWIAAWIVAALILILA